MKRFKGRGHNRGPGRGNNGPRWFNRKKMPKKNTSGPAEDTIPELADHYFDCNSFNEADRYINTKEKIIQYLGIKYGGDVRVSLEKMEVFQVPVPTDPVQEGNYTDDTVTDANGKVTVTKKARDKISYSEKKIFDKEIADYVDRKRKLSRNLEIAYSVIWGQCSETLQHKLKNSKRWEIISTTQNPIDLLEQIKVISYRYEEDKYLPMSIHNAKSAFYRFNQRDLSLNDYRERYTNVVEIATSYENRLYDDKLLDYLCKEKYNLSWEDIEGDDDYADEQKELHELAHEVTVATGFLASSDRRRYGKILNDLENDCIKGNNSNYPKDMASAYKMLNEYHTGIKGSSNGVQHTTQLAFAQTLKCFNCGKLGFTIKTCPDCSRKNNFNTNKGNNTNKPGKSDSKNQDKKSFAQVKEKSKAKPKKKQKKTQESAELGFMQLGSIEEEDNVEFSFVNICKVDSPSKTPLKTETEPENLSDINYTYGGSNIIGGEFSEYFTPSLVREMKQRDMCEGDNTAFTIEVSALHQETHLAQCLICGGRGFMGLKCQKCLCGVYNLVLGFCFYCKAHGMLGADCIQCKTGKCEKIAINCLNPITVLIKLTIDTGMMLCRKVLTNISGK